MTRGPWRRRPPAPVAYGTADGRRATASGALDPETEELVAAARERERRSGERREAALRWAAAAVVVVGAAAFSLVASARPFDPVLFVLLVAGYTLATRIQFEVGPGIAVPTELLLVPMLLLLPPPVVPAAVALGLLLGHLPHALARRSSATSVAAAVASASFAFAPATVALALHDPTARAADWVLLPVLVAAQVAGDAASIVVTEWITLRIRPSQLVQPLRFTFTVDALLAPLGLAVAAAAATSRFAVLLPISALFVLHRFARDRHAAISSSLELSRAYRGTALLLGDVIESDDGYTGQHSRAVVGLSIAIAERLRLSPEERRLTELVALLHDVGKIRIPNEVIRKPGALSSEERALIETHTVEGEQLLRRVGGLLEEVGRLVRSCHERWDGTGYPDGLAGEDIPLVARIVCCADAFDAMTTDRPYRSALTREAASFELVRCAGTHFDPVVVEALLAEVAGGPARERAVEPAQAALAFAAA